MKYSDVIGPRLNERIAATLRAFDKLIARYEKLIREGGDSAIADIPGKCPLCKIYRKTHCRLCPWRIYEGDRYCGDAAKLTPQENLKRIKRWKRRLLQEVMKGLLG